MRQFLLVVFLVFGSINMTSAQDVDVSIPISVAGDEDRANILTLRIASRASDEISPLDEYDSIIAPVPPSSQYDVRLRNPIIPSSVDATTDARATPTNLTEPFFYDIIYQPGSGNTGKSEIRINWDPADIAAIPEIESMTLQDNITGTLIGPIDMTQETSFSITENDQLWGVDFRVEIGFNALFLPVELINFQAELYDRDVELQWATASEENNAGFEIQHSSLTSTGDWESVGFVEGHGSTLEEQTYSYRVANLDPGLHKFRLKQVDYDGQFEYSPIVETVVDLPSTHALSSAYPNPFNPSTQFSLSTRDNSEVKVTLFDALGNLVETLFHGNFRAGQTKHFTIDGSKMASGIYLYRLEGTNGAGISFHDSKRISYIK